MSAPGTEVTRQLPLALRYSPDQRLDTFVGAPAGALEQLRALACEKGAQWLYLSGGKGVGKTHLALAVCAQTEATGRRAAYLPLRSTSGRLRDALEALDGYPVVVLDGVEVIAGEREGELALFDFHNRLRSAGGNLLYTARLAPHALPPGLPDLHSRLAQCARVSLLPLDDDNRREILCLRARRRGLHLDNAAIDWLLRHINRDLVSLTTLLDQIDHSSLAAQRRITVPFLRQVMDHS